MPILKPAHLNAIDTIGARLKQAQAILLVCDMAYYDKDQAFIPSAETLRSALWAAETLTDQAHAAYKVLTDTRHDSENHSPD